MNIPVNDLYGLIVVICIFGAIFAAVVVILWQGFKTYQIRVQTMASIAHEEAYRKLAEQVASSQEGIARDLADLRKRVASIEQVLKEVE